MKRFRFVFVVVAIFLGAFFTTQAWSADIFSGMEPRSNNIYSPQDQRIRGDKELVEFTENFSQNNKKYPFIVDADMEKYLNGLLKRLLVVAPAYVRQFEYRIHIVNAPDINASAIQGGVILLYLGALANASSEDCLASILSHEIGHIALQHAAAYATHELMILEEFKLIQVEIEKIKDLSDPDSERRRQLLVFLKKDCRCRIDMMTVWFNAGKEAEADIFGVRLAMAAGMDPFGFMRQLVSKEKDGRQPSANWRERSHLPSSIRLAMMKYEMSIWEKEYPVRQESSPEEFLIMKEKAKKLFNRPIPNLVEGIPLAVPCAR